MAFGVGAGVSVRARARVRVSVRVGVGVGVSVASGDPVLRKRARSARYGHERHLPPRSQESDKTTIWYRNRSDIILKVACSTAPRDSRARIGDAQVA